MYKDYDMIVLYHSGKANVIANALSQMTMGSVSHIDEAKKDLSKEFHRLARLGVSDIPWFHGIINTFSLSLVCPKVFLC